MSSFFVTMGEYDYVAIGEAPNDEVAATFSLALSSLGNVKTTTLRAISGLLPLRRGTIEFGGGIKIIARHSVGSGYRSYGRERAERDSLAIAVADPNFQRIEGIAAIVGTRLRHHAKDTAEQVEVVHIGRTQIDLQGREDIRDIDTKQLSLGAVDVEIQLRRRIFEKRIDLH